MYAERAISPVHLSVRPFVIWVDESKRLKWGSYNSPIPLPNCRSNLWPLQQRSALHHRWIRISIGPTRAVTVQLALYGDKKYREKIFGRCSPRYSPLLIQKTSIMIVCDKAPAHRGLRGHCRCDVSVPGEKWPSFAAIRVAITFCNLTYWSIDLPLNC